MDRAPKPRRPPSLDRCKSCGSKDLERRVDQESCPMPLVIITCRDSGATAKRQVFGLSECWRWGARHLPSPHGRQLQPVREQRPPQADQDAQTDRVDVPHLPRLPGRDESAASSQAVTAIVPSAAWLVAIDGPPRLVGGGCSASGEP